MARRSGGASHRRSRSLPSLPTSRDLTCQPCTAIIYRTKIEELLEHQFSNPTLLDEDLTKPGNQSVLNYERLEFLGEAVLGNLTVFT